LGENDAIKWFLFDIIRRYNIGPSRKNY